MKLKKHMKLIVVLIVCVIVISSISIYASYTYFAKDVSYIRNGKRMSVEDALNELYRKQEKDEKVKFMTQEEWNNLTLDEKIEKGLTVISNSECIGKYYDYTNFNNTVFNMNGYFSAYSGAWTVNFDSIEDRRNTLFISAVLDNSNNYTIGLDGASISCIATCGGFKDATMYNHVYLAPGFKNDSVYASYNRGDGGTYWSGCYAYDIPNGLDIVSSNVIYSHSRTINISVEKCKFVIFLINCGFDNPLSDLNYTINDDTYTLQSFGNHYKCNTYAGTAIYPNANQTGDYTITIPVDPGYGVSVTAVGIG